MGAMRAARNPDRYGPRSGSTSGANGSSRAARGYPPYNYDEEGFDDAFAARMGYGPPVVDARPAQTRTQGLARAILDGFTVVQFRRRDGGGGAGGGGGGLAGSRANGGAQMDDSGKASIASAGADEALALEPLRAGARSAAVSDGGGERAKVGDDDDELPQAASAGGSSLGLAARSGADASSVDLAAAGLGGTDEPNLALEETDEHCPICLLDFEDG